MLAATWFAKTNPLTRPSNLIEPTVLVIRISCVALVRNPKALWRRVRRYDAGRIMYPMVHHPQQRNRQQQQQPNVQTTQLFTISADEAPPSEDTVSIKRPRRPLHKRFFNYVRNAWTGVKSALGKIAKWNTFICLFPTNLCLQ